VDRLIDRQKDKQRNQQKERARSNRHYVGMKKETQTPISETLV
jgi:hypothetical protein